MDCKKSIKIKKINGLKAKLSKSVISERTPLKYSEQNDQVLKYLRIIYSEVLFLDLFHLRMEEKSQKSQQWKPTKIVPPITSET